MSQKLEESLMAIAFGEIKDTSREIFETLGRRYDDGERLFDEGDDSSDLFIILRGAVEVTRMGSEGSVLLATLGAEEILGEMSHFDDEPRSATARARGATDTLVFSRENFELIFQLHPKWTERIVVGLSRRLASTLEKVDASST